MRAAKARQPRQKRHQRAGAKSGTRSATADADALQGPTRAARARYEMAKLAWLHVLRVGGHTNSVRAAARDRLDRAISDLRSLDPTALPPEHRLVVRDDLDLGDDE